MSLVGISDVVHAAVITRLKTSAPLAAIIGTRIYSKTPENLVYPYIRLSETIETKASTFTEDGRVVLVRMHVWSQYNGTKEAWAIIGLIGDLLDEYDLTVSGAILEGCEVAQSTVMDDPDGLSKHGIVDLRVTVSE